MSRAYPSRPIVGIGVCVLKDDCVLLIRRAQPPSLGHWTLPGGAQELGETCEHAARREVMEETGISLGTLHLAAVVDAIHRDAAAVVQYHYTIIDYAACWAGGQAHAGSDAGDAVWAHLTNLAHYALADETLRVIAETQRLLEEKEGLLFPKKKKQKDFCSTETLEI